MPISVQIKCDICGAVKQQTNHWYLADISIDNGLLDIRPFDLQMAQEFNLSILCGEACVHKYISQNLASLHRSEAADQTTEFKAAITPLDDEQKDTLR